MKAWLKTISALAAAAVAVVLFRALFFAMYTVSGTRLEPVLVAGDRVLVNRWSYGLRTGGMNGLFGYGRICADSVRVGDIVAFDSPAGGPGGVLVCRCAALPGDTVATPGGQAIVPGKAATCAAEDHYWMQALGPGDTIDSRTLGPVAESLILGRVCLVVYSHDDSQPFYRGYRRWRTLAVPQ